VSGFDLFIRRPVATILIFTGVMLAGMLAYLQLPVAPLPKLAIPFITVRASMAGASPETMATSVATPLERHLGTIAGLDQMSSSSSIGFTNISLQFDIKRDIDGAARDVQAAINAARADLPAALRSNPTYNKFSLSDQPILVLTLTSPTLSQGDLYDSAYTVLQQKLSQVPGVGYVSVVGSSLPAVRVELNPAALYKYGIGLEDVRAALAAANANSPKGAIGDDRFHWQITSNDQAVSAAEYRRLIVAYRNQAAVRLSDVANVQDSVEDTRNFALSRDKQGVLVLISRQPTANIIDTVDRVKALLPELQASIPPAAEIAVAGDSSTMIRASLRDSQFSLVLSVVLVVLVVFAFLRDWRATVIPGVAVPISIFATFGVMYLFGYTLDTLSLIALTIATGFVVDDAIVVMENTVRHREMGEPRFRAALLGVREVGFTVLSMSLSLIAVFSPVLLLGGGGGLFLREFAVTITVAILASMVVSLTLTPMMCARLLRRPGPEHTAVRPAGRPGFFPQLLGGYERTLTWALRHQRLVLLVLVGTVGLNVWLFTLVPKTAFPEQDTGRLNGSIQVDQSSSFQHLAPKLKEFVDIVQADPAVQTVAGSTSGANSGRLYIDLKPLAVRRKTSEEVITRLRPQLARVTGATLYLYPVQYLPSGGGQSANALHQYSLQGDDFAELRTWTLRLVEALKTEPSLRDVSSDQQDQKGLEADLVIDRRSASRLGLTAQQIDNALYDAFGQRQVSTIYKSLNQYHVIMVAGPGNTQEPADLNRVYVSTAAGSAGGTQSTNALAGTVAIGGTAAASPAGANVVRNASLNSIAVTGRSSSSTGSAVSTAREVMIPLTAFAHYQIGTTPLAVNHQGEFVGATVYFNLAPGVVYADAIKTVNRRVAALHLPTSIKSGFQQNTIDVGNVPLLLLAAVAAIYVILGVLYESYAHPFTILSTLPSAGVGAFLALVVVHTELDLFATLGLFLLIGIVKKNAIMMVDLALALERSEGRSPRDTILKASLLRFRPILMTTLAALFGAIPLAIGFGSGAELRRPLGITIAGGLVFSQLLTLYTTPVVYLYVDRLRRRFARLGARFALARPAPAKLALDRPL
jgi:multidrug efflux pump